MDSITQATLGAAIGEAMLGKRLGPKGAFVGAAVATIPDLDVLLYLFYDKYEMLSIHRGLSHSIAFSLIGAFTIAYLLSKIKSYQSITYVRLTLFSWLCLFTHMLLDTFTAYGTQLLLPFSDRRMGWDSINVVDPVYTLPLIIGLILSVWVYRSAPSRSTYNYYGLLISTCYLLFTLVNKELVNNQIAQRMSEEKITYNTLMTMPVGVANVHWYGVAKSADSIYMVQHSIIGGSAKDIDVFPINDHLLQEVDPAVAEKMRWFAKGFYTVEKVDDTIRIYNLQVDMRGVVTDVPYKAPTAGYFEISKHEGEMVFSSGSHD